MTVPRQNIFVGTTNADVYLHDTTGNRRFWPVQITKIRFSEARKIIDQLWAEAVDAWRNKEKWWLADEVEKIAAEQQEGRLERDPWLEQVASYVGRRLPDNGSPPAERARASGHEDGPARPRP